MRKITSYLQPHVASWQRKEEKSSLCLLFVTEIVNLAFTSSTQLPQGSRGREKSSLDSCSLPIITSHDQKDNKQRMSMVWWCMYQLQTFWCLKRGLWRVQKWCSKSKQEWDCSSSNRKFITTVNSSERDGKREIKRSENTENWRIKISGQLPKGI